MESVPVLDMHKGGVYYRPLQPSDFDELKDAHVHLFPIDYEDSFFAKAVKGLSKIFTLGAFELKGGNETLVGFVTARLMVMNEMDSKDRRHMGLIGDCWNLEHAAYILTLGVSPKFQKQGIATTLICQLEQQAATMGARVVFLHVITYNKAAVRLYKRCQFRCVATLEDFYSISSGRQPDPNRVKWDAHLFSKFVAVEVLEQGRNFLSEGFGPLRAALDTCWPFGCRQQCAGASSWISLQGSRVLASWGPRQHASPDIFRRLFSRGKTS